MFGVCKKTIKILAIVLVVSIMIISCNSNKGNNELIEPDISLEPIITQSTNQDSVIENPSTSLKPGEYIPENIIEAKQMKIIYTADNTGKYYGLADWQTYIQDKYGVEIYVDYMSLSADIIFKENLLLDGILYLKYLDNQVSTYNTEVFKLSYSDFAYNLTDYYSKYGWDKFVDKKYIDRLNINGSIYAVPAIENKYIVPRYYNSKYLADLDMKIPETLPQFYEYLRAAKELNSNDDSFYPMVIFPMHTLSTADIFRANDVYFNSIMNNARTFNPNTNSFEDGVFSENIEEAVGFIRKLQKEELLQVYDVFGTGSNGVFNKNLATEYNIVYNTKTFGFSPYLIAESAYEYTNGYFLTGKNAKNICEIRNDIAFYMFPKSIENINGTIELFNRFFTDSEYYADLRYGVKGTNYFVIDGIPIKEEPIAGVLLNFKQIKPVYDLNASFVPESLSIVESIPTTLAYENNVFNQKWTYNDRGENRDTNNDTSIEFLFNAELSPSEAIEEYRKDFRLSGKLAILNDLNEKIRAVTNYDYGN